MKIKGRLQEDGAKLYLMVPRDRMKRNAHKLKQDISRQYEEELFFIEGSRALKSAGEVVESLILDIRKT